MKTLDFSEYSQIKEEGFKKAINKLLSETFILKEEDRNTYDFIKNNDIDINDYFGVMGYFVDVKEKEGYCYLMREASRDSSSKDPNSVSLSIDEKIFLAVLWQIYIERFIGNASMRVTILRKDLIDILKDYLPPKITNSPAQLEILTRVFKRHNIIKICGDITKDDCEIRIYPSVMLALDEKEIEIYTDNILKTNKADDLGNIDDDVDVDEEGGTDET